MVNYEQTIQSVEQRYADINSRYENLEYEYTETVTRLETENIRL
jgi:hypothetical protein